MSRLHSKGVSVVEEAARLNKRHGMHIMVDDFISTLEAAAARRDKRRASEDLKGSIVTSNLSGIDRRKETLG